MRILYGTVSTFSPLTVLVDGDTTPIAVVSCVRALPGQRVVMVAQGRICTVLGLVVTTTQAVLTPEGGIALPFINKTGVASVKGTIVTTGSVTDSFALAGDSTNNPIGVVYEAGVADGSYALVVFSGIAQVLMVNNTAATNGYVVSVGAVNGRAKSTNPATIGSTDHWRECGHFLETKTGGTDVLAGMTVHFN